MGGGQMLVAEGSPTTSGRHTLALGVGRPRIAVTSGWEKGLGFFPLFFFFFFFAAMPSLVLLFRETRSL
jgi:hypothetical protein